MSSAPVPSTQLQATVPAPASSFTSSITNCLSKLDPRQYVKQENLVENAVKLLIISGIAILILALTLNNPSAGYAFLAVGSVGALFAVAGLIYSAVKHYQAQKQPTTLLNLPPESNPPVQQNEELVQ